MHWIGWLFLVGFSLGTGILSLWLLCLTATGLWDYRPSSGTIADGFAWMMMLMVFVGLGLSTGCCVLSAVVAANWTPWG